MTLYLHIHVDAINRGSYYTRGS